MSSLSYSSSSSSSSDDESDVTSVSRPAVAARVLERSGSFRPAPPKLEPAKTLLCDYFTVIGLDYSGTPVQFGQNHSPSPVAPKKKGKGAIALIDVDVAYKGAELHRFPREDYEERPLPGHLWLFTFPTGIYLSDHLISPKFFVNALTYSDGSRSYVIGVKFYERTPWPNLDKATGGSKRGGKHGKMRGTLRGFKTPASPSMNDQRLNDANLYAPKALCFVSQLPLFTFFKSYLAEIYLLAQPGQAWTVPLERFIAQVVGPVPAMFSPSDVFEKFCRLVYTVGKTPITVQLPNLVADHCITDVSFRFLFQALSVENIVKLLAALLTEQKVIAHSQHYVLLVTVLQSLIDLLLPFQWPHTYIPIVPRNLLELVDAPTPFVMGVHVDMLPEMNQAAFDDLVVVDCDRNTLRLPSHFVDLPEDLVNWMRDKLASTLAKFGVSQKSKDFIEAEMEKIDLVFATRSAGYDSASSDAEFTLELRACVMLLFTRLFGDYQKFLTKSDNKQSRVVTLFDEAQFRESRDVRHRAFISECVCRTVFEMFLSSPEPKMFSLLVKLSLNYSEAGVLAELERRRKATKIMEMVIPEPEPGSVVYTYNQFPALDVALYTTSAVNSVVSAIQAEALSLAGQVRGAIAQKVHAFMTAEPRTPEFVLLAESAHKLLSGFRDGKVDNGLCVRMEQWFRGAAVDVLDAHQQQQNQLRASEQHQQDKQQSPSSSSSHLQPASSSSSHERHPSGSFLQRRVKAVKAKFTMSPRMSRIATDGRFADSGEEDGGDKGGDKTPVNKTSPRSRAASDGDSTLESASQSRKVRLENSREAMGVFMDILRIYCDLGEVKFALQPFRELTHLLWVLIDCCEFGLQQFGRAAPVNVPRGNGTDTVSSAEDETSASTAASSSLRSHGPISGSSSDAAPPADSPRKETGDRVKKSSPRRGSHRSRLTSPVQQLQQQAPPPKISFGGAQAGTPEEESVVICWSCGEVNVSGYGGCSSCGEAPLGSVASYNSSNSEDGGDSKSAGGSTGGAGGGSGGGIGSKKLSKRPPTSTVYVPRSNEERKYFDILKHALITGSAIMFSAADGNALQKLATPSSVWKRYELWDYFIFSDYMEKANLKAIEDPRLLPPYPILFPIAAFYCDCMAAVRLNLELAMIYICKFPFDKMIKDTLEQLTTRMYQSNNKTQGPELRKNSGSGSGSGQMERRGSTGGVRVVSKGHSVWKNVAGQVSAALSRTHESERETKDATKEIPEKTVESPRKTAAGSPVNAQGESEDPSPTTPWRRAHSEEPKSEEVEAKKEAPEPEHRDSLNLQNNRRLTIRRVSLGDSMDF